MNKNEIKHLKELFAGKLRPMVEFITMKQFAPMVTALREIKEAHEFLTSTVTAEHFIGTTPLFIGVDRGTYNETKLGFAIEVKGLLVIVPHKTTFEDLANEYNVGLFQFCNYE